MTEQDKSDEQIARQHERDNCSTCKSYKESGSDFHPPHFASRNCESGKRNHCTCDACF